MNRAIKKEVQDIWMLYELTQTNLLDSIVVSDTLQKRNEITFEAKKYQTQQ